MAAATKPIFSQVSCCFSSFSRSRRSILFQPLSYPKFSVVVMSLGNDVSSSEIKTSLTASADQCPFRNSAATADEEFVRKENVGKEEDDPDVNNAYGSAKLHDFCLGIPYGGFIISGGLFGSIFSRTMAPLSTALFGGALLFLSTLSLKNWRQGNSSLPFVLGQAVLSAALLWKNIRRYTLTKKLFPMGFYAVISAAMLCFYAHVMISGGNPPPKKLHSSANV